MLMFIVLQFLMLIIIAVRTFANGAQLPVEAIPVRASSLPTVPPDRLSDVGDSP
ncbi:hypothetical protein [Paraburkholderia youngii]|uniref:hypothetical protein n=1 Tax=Paraburkholderia youngii TaxID=2782701 RepID=UPI003D2613E0